MQEIEHNDIIDLIPAYALNSLDAEDADRVAQHVTTCAECQAELASFESVVDSLPFAAHEVIPAPALKVEVMRQIQTFPQSEKTIQPIQKPIIQSFRQRSTSTLAYVLENPLRLSVAAFVVLALLVSGVFIWRQQNPVTTQFLLTATDAAPGAQGVIEVEGNGRQAILAVIGLPELGPANQYQLWLIKEGQRVSGGVFSVNIDGSQNLTIEAPQPLVNYASFGITVEPVGGSPGPTGERVLEYNL